MVLQETWSPIVGGGFFRLFIPMMVQRKIGLTRHSGHCSAGSCTRGGALLGGTQSDLRFCENEGSKTFKINKNGLIGSKIKEKIYTKYIKSVK